MAYYRTILRLLIALAVALAPVGAAMARGAAIPVSAMPGMAKMAGTMAGVEDCHKMAHAHDSNASHSCCVDKSACPDHAACALKCCTMVLGVLRSLAVEVDWRAPHDRPDDPVKPPDWAMKPPAPPPRA